MAQAKAAQAPVDPASQTDWGAVLRRSVFDGLCFMFTAVVIWAAVTGNGVEEIKSMGHVAILLGALSLMVAGGLVSEVISRLGFKTLGWTIYAPPHKRIPGPPESLVKTFWGLQLIAMTGLCLIMGVLLTQANFVLLVYDINNSDPFAPLRQAGRLFAQLLQPDWTVLAGAIMAMVETIFVAFLATAIAVPIAFVLSFLTARNVMGETWTGSIFCTSLRTVFNISRSVEPVLWSIIFAAWVGIGPFAGSLALMIHSIASLAKQYSEAVESVEDGPIEGIRATGARPLQVVWYAVVPQIVLPYISFTVYRWDINVRMATILGLVGGGGIGTLLIKYQGQAMWHQVGTIVVVIAFVVWALDAFSAHVRSAIK